MKRILALLLALVLLASTAFAVGGASLSGSRVQAEAGKDVSIALNLKNNPGLVSWQLELNWDKSALTLDKNSVVLSNAFAAGMFDKNTDEAGKLYLVWAGTQNVTADGDLVTLRFTVSEQAKPGSYPVRIALSGARSESGEKPGFSVSDAVITLAGANTPPAGEDSNDTPKAENPFTDVSESAYYFRPTMWAVEHGITSGVTADRFAPNMTCTRAQAVTFLWRAAGQPKPRQTRSPFSDIKKDAYYYDAVLWAVEQGITSGVSAKEFAPDDSVTRAQAVTFLWRLDGAKKVGNAKPFTDVASDAYYAGAVRWALKNGITSGVSANEFAPGNSCTRSQIVTFLFRQFGE